MFANQEQLQKTGKDNMEAAMVAAGAQLAAVQKLAALNLDAIRGGYDAWTHQVRALAGAKDVQEFLQLQTSFLQPSLQSTVDYWQRVYGLTSEAQGQMAKLAERRLAETASYVTAALEEASRNLPAAAQSAMDTMKSMALGSTNGGHAKAKKAA